MDNNNLINEINKLKALIATLQQQLQTQQNVRSHWHWVYY